MELQLVNLTKEFGNFRAVNNLNLTISNGVYGLLGVNGAGKTTLMKMICSLLTPTSGKILCDGQDIGGMGGEYRNLLGYLSLGECPSVRCVVERGFRRKLPFIRK